MAIVGIDVDLTLVSTDEEWAEYLDSRYMNLGLDLPDFPDNNIDYNLGSYYPELKDPYTFWRMEDVYDNLTPLPYAEEVINDLCERHEVVFVSTIKGNHHKSKYNFLKRHFPKMSGFVATKEKQYVPCNVFIDDRNDVLNKVKAEHRIKMITPYTQAEELTKVVCHCNDWKHTGRVLSGFGY